EAAVPGVAAVTAVRPGAVRVGREAVAVTLFVTLTVGAHVLVERTVRALVAVVAVPVLAVPCDVVARAVLSVVAPALEAVLVAVVEAGTAAMVLVPVVPAVVDGGRVRGRSRGTRQRQPHEGGDSRHPVRVHTCSPLAPERKLGSKRSLLQRVCRTETIASKRLALVACPRVETLVCSASHHLYSRPCPARDSSSETRSTAPPARLAA